LKTSPDGDETRPKVTTRERREFPREEDAEEIEHRGGRCEQEDTIDSFVIDNH
jgi:hypothetical protein